MEDFKEYFESPSTSTDSTSTLVVNSSVYSSINAAIGDGPQSIKRLVFECPVTLGSRDLFCRLDDLEEVIFIAKSPDSANFNPVLDEPPMVFLPPGSFSYNPSLRRVVFPSRADLRLEDCFNDNFSLTEIIWPDDPITPDTIRIVKDSFNGCPNLSAQYTHPRGQLLRSFNSESPTKLWSVLCEASERLAQLIALFEVRQQIDPHEQRLDLPELSVWNGLLEETMDAAIQYARDWCELYKDDPFYKNIAAETIRALEEIDITTMLREAEYTLFYEGIGQDD